MAYVPVAAPVYNSVAELEQYASPQTSSRYADITGLGRFQWYPQDTTTRDGSTVLGRGAIGRWKLSDTFGNGSVWKQSSYVVATSNVALSGTQTIDGSSTADRVVLCVAQSTSSQNGPWTANASGAWTRPTWFDSSSDAQSGAVFPVVAGTSYAGSLWVLTSPTIGTIQIGTTALTFELVSGSDLVPTTGNLVTDLAALTGAATIKVDTTATVGTSVSLDSTDFLRVMNGGVLSIASGVTLTDSHGALTDRDLPLRKVFDYADETANVVFSAKELRPEWWGAVPGATDDQMTTAFRRMLRVASALGSEVVIRLTSGRTYTTGPLALWSSSAVHSRWIWEMHGAVLQHKLEAGEALFTFGDYATSKNCTYPEIRGGTIQRKPGHPKNANTAIFRISKSSGGKVENGHYSGATYGVQFVEEGGNHWLFSGDWSDCRFSIGPDLGAPAQNSNALVIDGRGQKIDQPGGVVFNISGSNNITIRGFDLSNCTAGIASINTSAVVSFESIYTEACTPDTVANTVTLFDITNSPQVCLRSCLVNGVGTAFDKSAKYGIRVAGAISTLELHDVEFHAHWGADVRLESDVDPSQIIIAPSCQSTYFEHALPRISNATGRRLRGGVTEARLPPAGRAPSRRVSADLSHPSWVLSGGANFTGATVTGPDGVTLVPVLELPTIGSSKIALLNDSPGGTAALYLDRDLDSCVVHVRFWARVTELVGAGTFDLARLEVLIQRFGIGGDPNSPTRQLDFSHTNGEWQFFDLQYTAWGYAASGASGYPHNSLNNLSFGASSNGSGKGFRVAIHGLDVQARAIGSAVPPYDDGQTLASSSGYGLLSASERQDLERSAQSAIRVYRRDIAYTELAAAASQTFVLGRRPPYGVHLKTGVRLTTPFTGGALATVLLDVGTSGDQDAIIAGADVKTAAVDGQPSTAPAGIAAHASMAGASADRLECTIRSTGANLNAATAGAVTIETAVIVPSTARVFRPEEISDLRIALDADDETSITSASSLISNVADLAYGSARDMAQGTGTNQPMLWVSDRGRRAICFNGVDNYLQGPDINLLMNAAAPGWTFAALLALDDTSNNITLDTATDPNTAAGVIADDTGLWGIYANKTKIAVGFHDGGTNRAWVSQTYTPGAWFVLTARYDGTTVRIGIDGTEVSAAKAIAGFAIGAFKLRLGKGNTGFARMRLRKLAGYGRDIGSTDAARIVAAWGAVK